MTDATHTGRETIRREPGRHEPIRHEMEALCQVAHWCSARGWLPATSGNFSVRDAATGKIFVSPSGLDKGRMEPADLLALSAAGKVVGGPTTSEIARPSAETALHRVVYATHLEANAILHVHTVWNTLLSLRFLESGRDAGVVRLEGFELLKALEGVSTHEYVEELPILRNTQKYSVLATELEARLRENPRAHGFLLSGHGLYTWGKTVAVARRHLEALEFLLEVVGRKIYG
jgi:methylthioribulose-1-phosphate dehydratase